MKFKKNKIYEKNILTVKELKELLNNFNDDIFVLFGSELYGFGINSYITDNSVLCLMSKDLSYHIDGGKNE